MRRLLGAILFLLLSFVYTTSAQSTYATTETIVHDDIERRYSIYEGADADKLLMVLHPFASSGRAMEVITGFNDIADDYGFVVVYPDAVDMFWDDGGFAAGKPSYEFAIDDFGFIATLMDNVSSEFNLNSRYVAGMGNGGQFAYALACQSPDEIDGIAVVSTLMIDHIDNTCEANSATDGIDVLMIHGQNDHLHVEEGRTFETGTYILGAQDTFITWLERNNCDPESRLNYRQTTLVTYENCLNDTRTAFFSVIGGGNNWFSTADTVNNYQIDASHIIGAFFDEAESWHELTQQPSPNPNRLPRTHTLYVPPTIDYSLDLPLVLLLHGRFANAPSQAYASAFNRIAKRDNVIALYPDAINTEWTYGSGLPQYEVQAHDDDTFLDMLIDNLDTKLPIDRERMYVTGLSNGGLMTQRLACTRADTYAAFAAVAATAPLGVTTLCDNTPAIPMLIMMGTADTIMPWQGATATDQSGRPIYVTAPMDNTGAFWANHNGCEGQYEPTNIPSDDPDSEVQVWRTSDCVSDTEVVIYAVIGGGHVWHGVRDFEDAQLGEVNMDINASEEIWTFFQQYDLSEPREPAPAEPTSEPIAEETEPEDEYATQREIIQELRGGGYTLYYTLDLDMPFECNSDGSVNLPDDVAAQIEAIQAAFELMSFPIGRVTAIDDCRALAVSDSLYGEPTISFADVDTQALFLLLSRPTDGDTLHLIVGDNDVISQLIQREVPVGNTLIVLPRAASGYQVLSVVPNEGWDFLATVYNRILERDGDDAFDNPDE
jgi:polyhydroxybutyrate depolymerase